MTEKIVCPKCRGNGYLGGSRDTDTQTDCDYCNNQGEVDITEETVNYGRDTINKGNGHAKKHKTNGGLQ